ncbi:MAG: bacillithiol biosynthesis cysteine-adding enzyme BshC [Candidatus Hydrogenedentota bacterium]
MRSFAKEYARGAADLLGFYAQPPSSLFDSAPASGIWDTTLVEAMRRYAQEIGSDATFMGNEAVIITGQQPAIFTGPMYTVFKAITVLKLSRAMRERFRTPVAPVFWIGSEDHDFEEARTAHFLTKDHRSLTLRYTPTEDVASRAMYRVPCDASLHEFIERAADESRGSEQSDDVRSFLHASLDASSSLSEWTARLLARLFRGTELVFFSPHLPEAREIGAAVIRREIETPLTSTRLLNEAGVRLERIGFPPQLTKGADECNFFLEIGEKRCKTVYINGRFETPESGERFSSVELLELLDNHSYRFSPNVALRCVVQQRLFPVAAYAAGPGELAYWAQLKPVFEHFSVPMPVVWPRASCVLTTLKLNKLRAKLGLELEDLALPSEELRDKAARAASTNPALQLARERGPEVERSIAALAEGLRAKDPTTADMAERLREEARAQLDRIERSIVRGDAAKNGAVFEQAQRLVNSLMPDRGPQERVYTIFSFLFEYGWDLIPRLIESIDPIRSGLQEIEL